MPTERVATAHGDVTYRTVTCLNCETEIKADEAISVIVGDFPTNGTVSLHSAHPNYVRGGLCPYCAEAVAGYDGPPTGVDRVKTTIVSLRDIDGFILILIASVTFMVLMLIVTVVASAF